MVRFPDAGEFRPVFSLGERRTGFGLLAITAGKPPMRPPSTIQRETRGKDGRTKPEQDGNKSGRPRGVSPQYRLDDRVKRLQESGSIALRQGRGAPHDLSRTPQLRQEIAGRHGLTDIVVREEFSGRTDHMGSLLQTSTRQRDIGGYRDIPAPYMFDDPIVGGVEPVFDYYQFYRPAGGNPHPGIGHQNNFKVITRSDAVNLLFDRTGIGIHENTGQTTNLTFHFDRRLFRISSIYR